MKFKTKHFFLNIFGKKDNRIILLAIHIKGKEHEFCCGDRTYYVRSTLFRLAVTKETTGICSACQFNIGKLHFDSENGGFYVA